MQSQQVESVKMWCKDKMAELTFHEAGRMHSNGRTSNAARINIYGLPDILLQARIRR